MLTVNCLRLPQGPGRPKVHSRVAPPRRDNQLSARSLGDPATILPRSEVSQSSGLSIIPAEESAPFGQTGRSRHTKVLLSSGFCSGQRCVNADVVRVCEDMSSHKATGWTDSSMI